MRPSNQRLRACGLSVGAMVLVFSPLRLAWASEPAQLTTPTGNVAANVSANVSRQCTLSPRGRRQGA